MIRFLILNAKVAGSLLCVGSKALTQCLRRMALATIGAASIDRFDFLKDLAIDNPLISLGLLVVWFVFSIGFQPLAKLTPAPLGAMLFIV